jgi:hypothetical protein
MRHPAGRAGPPPRIVVSGISLALLILAAGPRQAQAQSAVFDTFPQASPRAGEMAPPFELQTVDNETFDLMEVLAEKPVVIEFGSFT